MDAYVIKFINGMNKDQYYAGCNKANAKTLLGAQLYKSEKTALNTINKSINFPNTKLEDLKVIKVTLEEAPKAYFLDNEQDILDYYDINDTEYKIKIGREYYAPAGNLRFVVLKIYGDLCQVLYEDGQSACISLQDEDEGKGIKYTGRYFPQVKELMMQIKDIPYIPPKNNIRKEIN